MLGDEGRKLVRRGEVIEAQGGLIDGLKLGRSSSGGRGLWCYPGRGRERSCLRLWVCFGRGMLADDREGDLLIRGSRLRWGSRVRMGCRERLVVYVPSLRLACSCLLLRGLGRMARVRSADGSRLLCACSCPHLVVGRTGCYADWSQSDLRGVGVGAAWEVRGCLVQRQIRHEDG